MTLTGENCHRWLINHKKILEGLKIILIESLEIQGDGIINKSELTKEKLKRDIDTLISNLTELMELFDVIISIMREQRKHTYDECEIFEKACLCFGSKWREYQFSVTPKVHQVESHCCQFMWKYRRFFAEDSIERKHHTNKCYKAVLTCVHRWWEKLNLKEKRTGVGIYNDDVAQSLEFAKQATKRIKSSTLTEDKTGNDKRKKTMSDAIKSEARHTVIKKLV